MRIAMWSGPRNLSTAMMYSFASRSDCAVWDEPFYAAYLDETGLDHPLKNEILTAHEKHPSKISDLCKGPTPNGKTIWYQKHMCQHMLPSFDLGFMDDCTNVFLIRHPARVIASYAAKRENPTADDLGFHQQMALVDRVKSTGQKPIVIDSTDIRAAPEAAIKVLCKAIGMSFEPAMLSWPKGPNPADGVWAKHWYGAIHKSTGFAGAEARLPVLEPEAHDLLAEILPIYHALEKQKLVVNCD